jgi:hypothetical protein
VSTAALECLFSMIKFVSTAQDVSANKLPAYETTNISEATRESLWSQSWKILAMVSCCDLYNADISLQFCQNLSALYNSSCDQEFRYSRNIRDLLKLIVLVSRPQYQSVDDVKCHHQGPNDWQMYRCIIELLKKIKASCTSDFAAIVATTADICFGNRIVMAEGAQISRYAYFGPCPLKLRTEAATILLSNELQKVGSPIYSENHFEQLLQIVVERFTENIFSSAIEAKIKLSIDSSSKSINQSETVRLDSTNQTGYLSFFSAMKTFLVSQDSPTNEAAVTHSTEIQNNKANESSLALRVAKFDVPNGDVWVPAHLLVELKSVNAVLNEFVKSYQISSIKSWSHLKRVLLVILSPWKYSELVVTDYNLTGFGFGDSEESSLTIASIVNTVFVGIAENQ